ncbi:MAG: PPOX class F420-dependent oxidoreductase [Caldilineaceae bacterium SB0661_bin_32]|uniref:PPOX class F420-dependent oxidoreductase n=1 Tax=Caldilineaceae bacterium SB0661_bin_32 TaxID=2605255 RepID=A0A6B1D9R0_9CHLR|nr:PPOX class F420-dependent oxidoreductase [Caldilineaceae bacterium SB0661_bin_32]
MDVQVSEFLQADRHAVLATNGRKGAPQLTPVWYIYEDGVFYVSAQTRTVKVKNLRRDPTVTICIDGGRGDARYVALYGKAELIEPGERQRDLRWRIVRHYYADEATAARYYETVKDTVGVIVTLRPERIVSMGFGQS